MCCLSPVDNERPVISTVVSMFQTQREIRIIQHDVRFEVTRVSKTTGNRPLLLRNILCPNKKSEKSRSFLYFVELSSSYDNAFKWWKLLEIVTCCVCHLKVVYLVTFIMNELDTVAIMSIYEKPVTYLITQRVFFLFDNQCFLLVVSFL